MTLLPFIGVGTINGPVLQDFTQGFTVLFRLQYGVHYCYNREGNTNDDAED